MTAHHESLSKAQIEKKEHSSTEVCGAEKNRGVPQIGQNEAEESYILF